MENLLVEQAVKLRALEAIPNDFGTPHLLQGHNMTNCVFTMPPAEMARLNYTTASFVPYLITNAAARHSLLEIYGSESIYSMLPGTSDLHHMYATVAFYVKQCKHLRLSNAQINQGLPWDLHNSLIKHFESAPFTLPIWSKPYFETSGFSICEKPNTDARATLEIITPFFSEVRPTDRRNNKWVYVTRPQGLAPRVTSST